MTNPNYESIAHTEPDTVDWDGVVFAPRNDWVLVSQDIQDEKTKGGLYIPEGAQLDRPQHATIMAVGPGPVTTEGVRVGMGLEVGDKVTISSTAGADVVMVRPPAPGVPPLVLMPERHIVAKVTWPEPLQVVN